MRYQRNLTFEKLINVIWKETSNYGRSTQRDIIKDIADLSGCHDIALESSSWFERYLGIKYNGTVMTRNPDFGIWESDIVDSYRITWSKDTEWAIEEL